MFYCIAYSYFYCITYKLLIRPVVLLVWVPAEIANGLEFSYHSVMHIFVQPLLCVASPVTVLGPRSRGVHKTRDQVPTLLEFTAYIGEDEY